MRHMSAHNGCHQSHAFATYAGCMLAQLLEAANVAAQREVAIEYKPGAARGHQPGCFAFLVAVALQRLFVDLGVRLSIKQLLELWIGCTDAQPLMLPSAIRGPQKEGLSRARHERAQRADVKVARNDQLTDVNGKQTLHFVCVVFISPRPLAPVGPRHC